MSCDSRLRDVLREAVAGHDLREEIALEHVKATQPVEWDDFTVGALADLAAPRSQHARAQRIVAALAACALLAGAVALPVALRNRSRRPAPRTASQPVTTGYRSTVVLRTVIWSSPPSTPTTQPLGITLADPVKLALASGTRTTALRQSHLRSDDPGINFQATTDATGHVFSLTVITPTGKRDDDPRSQLGIPGHRCSHRGRHTSDQRGAAQSGSARHRTPQRTPARRPATRESGTGHVQRPAAIRLPRPPARTSDSATAIFNLFSSRAGISEAAQSRVRTRPDPVEHHAVRYTPRVSAHHLAQTRGLGGFARLADAPSPDSNLRTETQHVDRPNRGRPAPRRLGPRHLCVLAPSPQPQGQTCVVIGRR